MNRFGILNIALILCLPVLVFLAVFFHFDPEKRNPYLINNMVDSPAYADQSVNPVLPHHQTLQSPVPGTVPVGWEPTLPQVFSDKDMARASKDLANPYTLGDATASARGQVVFERMCVICHGPQAKGDGAATKKGFPAPPSLLTPRMRNFGDGAIFYKITYGGKLMPAYAIQVAREDRWKCALYIRKLQETYPAPGKDKP